MAFSIEAVQFDQSLNTTDAVSFASMAITNTSDASSASVAPLKTAGGLAVAKKVYVGSATPSTSTITGALVVSGGIGCAGNLTVNIVMVAAPITYAGYLGAPFTQNGIGVAFVILNFGAQSWTNFVGGAFTANSPANGNIRYIGATTRYFHVNLMINVKGSQDAHLFTLSIYKNLADINGADATISSEISSTTVGHMSVGCVVSLAQNDYLAFYCRDQSGTANYTFSNAQVFVHPIA